MDNNPYSAPDARIAEPTDRCPPGVIGWIRAGWICAALSFLISAAALVFLVRWGLRGWPTVVLMLQALIPGMLAYAMYKRSAGAAMAMLWYFGLSQLLGAAFTGKVLYLLPALPLMFVFFKAYVALKRYHAWRAQQRQRQPRNPGARRISDEPLFRDPGQ